MQATEQQSQIVTDNSDFDPQVMGGSMKRKIVNPLLVEERAKCNFNQQEAYRALVPEGQREELETYKKLITKYPEIITSFNYYEKTRAEKMAEWWDRYRVVWSDPEFRHLFANNSRKKCKNQYWQLMFQGMNPMLLHTTMFTKTIMLLGSEEQVNYYEPLINHWQIIGAYAQTELGHGSDFGNLETRATYDMTTDEFVIHTPTVKAAKFWPGNIGIQCTHTMIMARCISQDNDYGVQPFIVQVRDPVTHKPLPGIEIGDIGAKLSWDAIDNAYLKFTHFRVPRFALLNRFTNITTEGEFEMKADPRILYTIMVQTRIDILDESATALHRAAMTATRYAVCRRQFANQHGTDSERKLIDYELQMDKLAQHLSNGIVLTFIKNDLNELSELSNEMVSNGSFKLLDTLHHYSCGMKAIGTDMCYVGIDELRQACGGAGNTLASGISYMWKEYAASVTVDGVTPLMFQQASRLIIKTFNALQEGKPIDSFFAYMRNGDKLLSQASNAKTVEQFLDLDHLARALATRSWYLVRTVNRLLAESKAPFVKKQNELFATEINMMAKTHLVYIIFERARKIMAKQNFQDPKLAEIMNHVLRNFAMKQLLKDPVSLYECGFLKAGSNQLMQLAYKQTLSDMRPQMIGLVEILPDNCHPTTIGNSYGDIYEHAFSYATQTKLNYGPNAPPLFASHIKDVRAIAKKALEESRPKL